MGGGRSPNTQIYNKFEKLKKSILTSDTELGLLRKVDPSKYFPLREGDPSFFTAPPLASATSTSGNLTLDQTKNATNIPLHSTSAKDQQKTGFGTSKTDYTDGVDFVESYDADKIYELETENYILGYLSLLPKIIERLAELYKTTKRKMGTLLEYHQKVLCSNAFAGFAAVRLGEIGISNNRKYLQQLFRTTRFDSKICTKVGRRFGKTYTAAAIIAALLVSQPNCSGIMLCIKQKLARENCSKILRLLKDIIEDPQSPVKGAEIVSASVGDGTIKVKSVHGTLNEVYCTPDPKRSNQRGQGTKEGFFFLDESDFYDQKSLDTIQPIFAMRILACMFTSQSYSVSPASKMVANAIEPNGKRTWREYTIKPGHVSLLISDDYAPLDTSREDSEDFILNGKTKDKTGKPPGINGNNAEGNAAQTDPLRSLRRPWYNPISKTLNFQRYQLRQLEIERNAQKDEAQRQLIKGKKNKNNNKKTGENNATAFTDFDASDYADGGIQAAKDFAEYNAYMESLVNQRDRKREMWTTAECIWLFTLPGHLDVIEMRKLKTMMLPEEFAREMLGEIPELNFDLHPAFPAEAINRLFHPDNRFNEIDLYAPIRWLISFDPASGGSSDSTILSALVYQGLPTYSIDEEKELNSNKTQTQKYVDRLAKQLGIQHANAQSRPTTSSITSITGGSTTMARTLEKTGSASMQQTFVVRLK